MRDPVFVVALLLCLTTRFALKPLIDHWFVHEYLNDMLCLPLFLPVILQVQAWLRIRPREAMPTLLEVLHNGIVFTAVFELLLPRLTMFDSVADPWDAVAYLAGGFVAYAFWNFRASPCAVNVASPESRPRRVVRAARAIPANPDNTPRRGSCRECLPA